MKRFSCAIAILLGGISAAKGNIIDHLPESADEMELQFQPLLDYDNDGCYNTAAISPDGILNPGRQKGTFDWSFCHEPEQLKHSNAYSRKRCNNGICAIMYAYYFERDGAGILGDPHSEDTSPHNHDWENIVVFVRGDEVIGVDPSCEFSPFGKNDNKHRTGHGFILDGYHPMVVYHKNGYHRHCFRRAFEKDIKEPENFTKQFYRSLLVGWDHWPDNRLRDKMVKNWPHQGHDGIAPQLDEPSFSERLWRAGNFSDPRMHGFDPDDDE